ncbi:MAG: HD domain-containing protein, partial [Dethiosulfovibrio sp.]|nr:HD domain-containing protein [Dethiosulfovibrio sp.]
EWAVITRHPEVGYRIARATSSETSSVADEILSHHEKWDGGGYPNGLKGEKIPFLSRILSILDAFDVMTHDRPYRKARTVQEALEEIRSCSGSQFDPSLVELFLSMNRLGD